MHRWKFSVLAAAAVLSASLYATDASALTLGRITVQSALGEPLRAEIDLPLITTAEAESLHAVTASPEVFRAYGLEYSPSVNSVQVQLQRRADGTMVLRLSSTRPINDPFVDFAIDATWNSGHIVRSYTMLFDPPALRRPPATVTAAPQATAPTSPPIPEPAAPAAPSPAARRVQPEAAPAGDVTVRSGDTAGRIAAANRPAGVSLDQMLVAMLRANPDAFIHGNVNRLRSGAVLQMPDQAQAQATPVPEARQIIAAQSKDFNEYRRRLAGSAPSASISAADRSASGSVQTQIEDKKPTTTAPDKLTLSKGSVQSQKAEDQLAREKQASEAAARMAELSKNISELNKLGAASAAADSPAGAASAASNSSGTPSIAVAPAATAATAATAASTPAATASAKAAPETATPAASQPADAASAPASTAAPAPAPASQPAPLPSEKPSFLSSLWDEPLLAGGALAAILALIGYGGYRVAQRRREQTGVESSFMESRLQPDSFFGASGGRRVDTASNELSTGSSMAYSPSQLDVGGDVDPVAEADVYLAYGRDLQAEEILKEAARHKPERSSVQVKLAEIYAKRQDRKALESVATNVFALTNGQGPEWTRIADLGRNIDPENALYRPGGRPSMPDEAPETALPPGGFASTMPNASTPAPIAMPPDLDLDLNLGDLPLDIPHPASAPVAAAAPGAFAAMAAAAMAANPVAARPEPALDPDLGALELPRTEWDASAPETLPSPFLTATEPTQDAHDFAATDLSLLDSGITPLTANDAKAPAIEPAEFDLGDLSLDLDTPLSPAPSAQPLAASAPAASAPLPDDPLATKLALAVEFNAIGDTEGARTLIEEVIAEASGPLKARAQRLLDELG